MPMETDDRNDTAVYWAATGRLTKHAKPILSPAVEIMVRWENRIETIYGKDIAPLQIEAVLVVDQDIPEGSILWRGELADVASATDLMRVVKFTDVPDIKGIEHRRLAYLGRYGDSLPEVESGTGT